LLVSPKAIMTNFLFLFSCLPMVLVIKLKSSQTFSLITCHLLNVLFSVPIIDSATAV
jgi:hypothetical protein